MTSPRNGCHLTSLMKERAGLLYPGAKIADGYFCAYPNNRILWAEPSMVSEPFKNIPDYKLNMKKYHCESHDKWATSDDDDFFYQIKTENKNPTKTS
jgi:hypothetical protein